MYNELSVSYSVSNITIYILSLHRNQEKINTSFCFAYYKYILRMTWENGLDLTTAFTTGHYK
jgi:hypothetical protein